MEKPKKITMGCKMLEIRNRRVHLLEDRWDHSLPPLHRYLGEKSVRSYPLAMVTEFLNFLTKHWGKIKAIDEGRIEKSPLRRITLDTTYELDTPFGALNEYSEMKRLFNWLTDAETYLTEKKKGVRND